VVPFFWTLFNGLTGGAGYRGVARKRLPRGPWEPDDCARKRPAGLMGEIWRFRGEPAGRWGRVGTAIGSVDCENRATRCVQMDVSTDNVYGETEAGGWVDGSPLRGGGGEGGKHRATMGGKHRAITSGKHRAITSGKHRAITSGKHRAIMPGKHRAITSGKHDATMPGKHNPTLGGICKAAIDTARREVSHAEHGNQEKPPCPYCGSQKKIIII
jgi:hypothetical protein